MTVFPVANRRKCEPGVNPISIVRIMPNVDKIGLAGADRGSNPMAPFVLTLMSANETPMYADLWRLALILKVVMNVDAKLL